MDGSTLSNRSVARRAHGDFPALAATAPIDCLASNDVDVLLDRGQVALDGTLLRRLRQSRLLSQQDLAEDCWQRNIRVSIATIKRAESGRAVRFRIARELARCFDIPVMRIIRVSTPALLDGGRVGFAAMGPNDLELTPA